MQTKVNILVSLSLLMLIACAPKEHDGKYTHQQFWNNEVHRGHDMSSGQRHDAGHDFECTANGYRLDHCDEDHGGQR